jgi:dihydropteroate synthase
MSSKQPPTTLSKAGARSRGMVAPLVRVFALSPGEDLVNEVRMLEVADRPSSAGKLLQVAVKLVVPSDWQVSISCVVSSFTRLTLFTHTGNGPEDTLLIIGQAQEVEAWARALSSADLPAAPLAREILAQLAQVYPRLYQTFACGERSLDFSVKTGVMGILNVTPDSFYDGGRYLDPHAAVDHAHQMLAEGADIIDIGGQSSRPGSDPVSAAEEERRVLPIVEAVAKSVSAIISVDTYRARVALAALDAGAQLINDISALRFDPALVRVVAERRVPLILMHMQGMPRTMQLNPTYEALIDEVFAFLQERLRVAQAGGIAAEQLLIDPGIGFGKGAQHNLELLRKLHHFHAIGRPLVIGTSRKSFIGRILGTEADERLEGTAATVAVAIVQGADIIRVHDVGAMARVARMMDALVRPNFSAHAAASPAVELNHRCGAETRGE